MSFCKWQTSKKKNKQKKKLQKLWKCSVSTNESYGRLNDNFFLFFLQEEGVRKTAKEIKFSNKKKFSYVFWKNFCHYYWYPDLLYRVRQIFFFFGNALKNLLNMFSNFFFYLKVQSFRLRMENKFIQMAGLGWPHAVTYTVGPSSCLANALGWIVSLSSYFMAYFLISSWIVGILKSLWILKLRTYRVRQIRFSFVKCFGDVNWSPRSCDRLTIFCKAPLK